MISVIIPAFNEQKDLANCLQSLLKQKNVDFELIVINDGSTDNTKFAIQNLPSPVIDLKIQYFEQKHQGPGAARNLGAAHANGNILVFVDCDMTFKEDFLNKLTQPIIKGDTKGTFTKEEFVSNWSNVWARCWNFNQGMDSNRRIPINYPDQAPVFRALLRSEFKKVGGFDLTGYTDDWSLSRKLGYKASLASKAICYHKNPESLEEVYLQARWIGKNEFIIRGWRKIFNLVKYFAPVSLIIGLVKAFIYCEPKFIQFKMVYDQAVFVSITESFFKKTLYK